MHDSLPPDPPILAMIGNGMMGHRLCEKLVFCNAHRAARIIVFAEESRPAYDRVKLTEFLEDPNANHLQLAPAEWYAQHGIQLHLADPVVHIDRQRRLIRSASGRQVHYHTLVFATGSRALLPQIPGAQLPGVFTYRTIDDLAQIRQYARPGQRVAVLGGGLVGLEAARALADMGLESHVVELADRLMPGRFNTDASDMIQRLVRERGVHIHLGRQTQRIDARGDRRLLYFSDGAKLGVDMVIVASGIRPRDDLAAASGLQCCQRGGIVVDDQLRTSDPHIYAIGACARHNGLAHETLAPGYRMVEVLIENLLGHHSRFTPPDSIIRMKLSGVEVIAMGDCQAPGGQIVSHRNGNQLRQLLVSNGRLVGALAVGRWEDIGRIQDVIQQRQHLPRPKQWIFRRTGHLWMRDRPVHDWPAPAHICNCLGVTRGTLGQAIDEGHQSVEQLIALTGASTVCGSCRPLLEQLASAARTPTSNGKLHASPGLRPLAILSALSLLLVLLIVAIPSIQYGDSVQSPWYSVEILWRDSFYRQVTGFTVLALALSSLTLSLRKRIPRLRFGELAAWRVAHAALALAALAALALHTGLNLGSGLNFALLSVFLSVCALGSLAGLTALAGQCGPSLAHAASSWRPRILHLHTGLLLILSVLLGFHILKTYYF